MCSPVANRYTISCLADAPQLVERYPTRTHNNTGDISSGVHRNGYTANVLLPHSCRCCGLSNDTRFGNCCRMFEGASNGLSFDLTGQVAKPTHEIIKVSFVKAYCEHGWDLWSYPLCG